MEDKDQLKIAVIQLNTAKVRLSLINLKPPLQISLKIRFPTKELGNAQGLGLRTCVQAAACHLPKFTAVSRLHCTLCNVGALPGVSGDNVQLCPVCGPWCWVHPPGSKLSAGERGYKGVCRGARKR